MPLKTHGDEIPAVNVTPMIDVVLVLIIFFMLGTEFASVERMIDLDVPQVADNGTLTAAPMERVVNVLRDGSVTLDLEPITIDALASRLSAARDQYADLSVVVRGDADARHQNMADVLNACRLAGIVNLAVSVIPLSE
jgi:biopolymer transport protein ExbD